MKRAFPKGPPDRPTLAHRIEYIGLQLFLGGARLVPRRWALGWARLWGRLAFDVVRMRRRVAMENLRHAFPDEDESRLVSIARAAYRGFGMTMMEVGLNAWTPAKKILELCEVVGQEELDRTLEQGKGGILLAAHFGNWEIMGGYLALRGYPINFIVRSQRNPLVNRQLNDNRRRMEVKIIPVGQAVRQVYRNLRDNEFVAILADQDAGPDGLFLDFLGRPASVPVGPAVFARRNRCPILIGVCLRLPKGRFRIIIDCTFKPDASLSEEEDVRRLAEAYTRRLEATIREHPEHWFWMHRRWKSQPPDDRRDPEDHEVVPCAG
jgi:KDO2-lipid IV(A) lauroyltransferase